MFWFQYLQTPTLDIFNNIIKIQNYWLVEILVLIIWLALIIWFTFFLIPRINIYFLKYKQAKEKSRKRKLIDKIVLQKNLEDLIKREVEGVKK